jgi:hypothetical protein
MASQSSHETLQTKALYRALVPAGIQVWQPCPEIQVFQVNVKATILSNYAYLKQRGSSVESVWLRSFVINQASDGAKKALQ